MLLFVILGILATVGYGALIIEAWSAENAYTPWGLIGALVATLVGLAWMGLMADGVAELLAPSKVANS